MTFFMRNDTARDRNNGYNDILGYQSGSGSRQENNVDISGITSTGLKAMKKDHDLTLFHAVRNSGNAAHASGPEAFLQVCSATGAEELAG